MVALEQVHKAYGKNPVVKGLSLEVARGELRMSHRHRKGVEARQRVRAAPRRRRVLHDRRRCFVTTSINSKYFHEVILLKSQKFGQL